MFKSFLISLLVSTQCFAGLPPTSVKGQDEASPVTTFSIQTPYNQATTTGAATRLVETGNGNLLVNPSFEHSTYSTGWGALGSTTPAVETTIIRHGKKSAKLTLAAQSGLFWFQNVTPTIQLDGMNIEYGMTVKTAVSGVQVCALNAGSIVGTCTNVSTNNKWQYYPVGPIAGPSSGSVGVGLYSPSGSTGDVYTDDTYVGPARNIGTVQQAQFIGSLKYLGTTSCQWTSASTSLANFAADTDCPTASVTGSVTAPGTKIPGAVVSNLGAGTYKVTVKTNISKTGTVDAIVGAAISDGTTASAAQNAYANTTNGAYGFPITLVGYFTYTTAQSSVTFQVQGVTNSGSNAVAISSNFANQADFEIAVEYIPSSAQTVINQSSAAWYVDATMDGANPDLGTSNQASYVEITNASLTLKPQTGSAPVGVMCSSTNAATAPSTGNTTCAAGSESVGMNFTIPLPGAYEVCFYGTHYSQVNSGVGVDAAFQLIETPTNAQTLTLEGGTRLPSNHIAMTIATGTGDQLGHPVSNCSIFNWTSSGTKGVRLMYEQSITGTPTSNILIGDAAASVGQRNMRWTVKPVTGAIPAPLLVGSVTSSSTGLEKIDRARITISGASTCTYTQTGNWITSCTASSTIATVTFNSGYYSGAPDCWFTTSGNSANTWGRYDGAMPTSTSVVFRAVTTANAASNEVLSMFCQGPR